MRSRPADRPAVFRVGCGGRLLVAALAWAGLGIQAAMAGAVPAGYESLPSVDWYYASSFGTGKYRAGERSVTVLRVPAAWSLPEREDREWSARILLPLTLGAVDFGFDDILEEPLDSVSLVTFTPGVEFLLPAGKGWLLRPFATFGGGAEFDGGDRAWIYSAGISATRPLGCERWRCTLGLALTWAGYRSSGSGQDSMSSLAGGFDFVAPIGPHWAGRTWQPGVFVIYRNYLTDMDFIFDPQGLDPLSEEWELGLSLTAAKGFSIFGYRFERFGLSYRRADGLKGLHLVSRFPF
jgi:hypothetical protein